MNFIVSKDRLKVFLLFFYILPFMKSFEVLFH